MHFSLAIDADARATVTTQTAERAYRAASGSAPAELEVEAHVGAGAYLQWLPQETILFDGASLERRTRIELSASARLLMCEMLVFGRQAMGEEIATLWLMDRREVLRDGIPVFVDPLAITGSDLAQVSAGAGVEDMRCLATVLMLGKDAEDRLGAVRMALKGTGYAGASAWEGKLVVRAKGPNPTVIRRLVADVIETLRDGPAPRVWQI